MKDFVNYIIAIVNDITIVQNYTDQISIEIFEDSILYQDAISKRIENIGELANKISLEDRLKHPTLPWNQIRGLRNILVHNYNELDTLRLWQIATINLPELRTELNLIIDSIK
jgi:uncharacterized protein with HEPN domain